MEKREALMEVIENAASDVFIHLSNEELDGVVDRFTRLVGAPDRVYLLRPTDRFNVSVTFQDGITAYIIIAGGYETREEASEIYHKYLARTVKSQHKYNAV